jgi:hypothetical protein
MTPYRCKCGSFASPVKPCLKCGRVPVSNKVVCSEHDWLNQLDHETGEPIMVCQTCGLMQDIIFHDKKEGATNL